MQKPEMRRSDTVEDLLGVRADITPYDSVTSGKSV